MSTAAPKAAVVSVETERVRLQDCALAVAAAPAAERYRSWCAVLAAAMVLIATGVALIVRVRINPAGADTTAVVLALLLIIARLALVRTGWQRLADVCGTVGFSWLGAVVGGALALLTLRLQFPLEDRALLASDHALGIDAIRLVRWQIGQGQWLFTVMATAYNATIPLLALSMILLAALGRRIEAWRAALCFLGSLLTICVIAALTPAKGLALWAPADLLRQLPYQAMRYFWPAFDSFYSGADPVLSVHSLDGVISFPSFHAAMGCITAAMWRGNGVTFALTLLLLVLILLATFPFGGHYGVDLIAGVAVWAAWFALSRQIEDSVTVHELSLAPSRQESR